ncbi:MAG: hypothetical protein OXC91_08465, partial [Rhodobacteraceae bacterium]|nr:hypothetical protein [Paracoccaceae bacterium]
MGRCHISGKPRQTHRDPDPICRPQIGIAFGIVPGKQESRAKGIGRIPVCDLRKTDDGDINAAIVDRVGQLVLV